MKAFADLFNAIDQSTKTTIKVKALSGYFEAADESDKLWTIALFSGRRPKRAVTTTKLREWAAEVAAKPYGERIYRITKRVTEHLDAVPTLAEAVSVALSSLAGPDRTLTAADLEVAVLDRVAERRCFRRLDDDAVAALLT